MRAFSKVPSTRAAVTLGLIVQDSAGPKERDCDLEPAQFRVFVRVWQDCLASCARSMARLPWQSDHAKGTGIARHTVTEWRSL